ncbi:hypothetical protein ACMV5L_01700 [Serratia plymuthica]|uniref:hypothetical protein n=1 Tax=Serratia plymuthica TaxID=82996 RepID=UPI003DA39524
MADEIKDCGVGGIWDGESHDRKEALRYAQAERSGRTLSLLMKTMGFSLPKERMIARHEKLVHPNYVRRKRKGEQTLGISARFFVCLSIKRDYTGGGFVMPEIST